MIISLLRKEARENLKGKWKKAFIIMFLFYIINILTGTITTWIATTTPYGLITLVLNIAITIPLNYGLLVSFIKLKRNEEVNCFHFVYYAIRDLEKVWKVLGKLILKQVPLRETVDSAEELAARTAADVAAELGGTGTEPEELHPRTGPIPVIEVEQADTAAPGAGARGAAGGGARAEEMSAERR